MKKLSVLAFIAVITFLVSCRGGENKIDTSGTVKETTTPVTTDTSQRVSDEKIPIPESRSGVVDSPVNNERNEILSNIDKHLVSTVQAPSSGGAGSVTVENKLTDASFQKVLVEVSEVSADGIQKKTSLYTLVNIEPGEKKVAKLPNVTAGVKLVAHVVKAKSTELTNGEMILVGSRYSPQ